MSPTIFALASGVGRAAIAIVRLSGPRAGAALEALAGRRPPPRRAVLARLRDPGTGAPLDQALVLFFPAPASFTGEDAAELHLHGGRAVVRAVLAALARLDGLRPAEPGEFTRRAFRAGRMSLAEVEGLADLIDAETEAQRRQALRLVEGALGRWAEGLRDELLNALALAEGVIDFAEEDDVAAVFAREILPIAARVQATISQQLALADRAGRVRDGLVIALAGPPNAGKSTLLNALAGREVAIVSPLAGTTRDAIEVALDLDGVPVTIVDTAGLRPTEDPVEQAGIARALARARSADLVLWLDDGSGTPLPDGIGPHRRVATKVDIRPLAPGTDLAVSAKSGEGMDALIGMLRGVAADATGGAEAALVSHLRHRLALEAARDALTGLDPATIELAAEDLRRAVSALERLVGRIDVEEVLGAIFARFCIGK